MAAPARRLARAPRRALTEAQILRLVRFPAIRRALSGGLANVSPLSVDIPKGGRFIRFRLVNPRAFHPALFATMPLGGRGTLGVIGTKLAAVKRKSELASFIRRMGARLKGRERKGMIYQLRTAGIIGPSALQAVLIPRSRVEQVVARFTGSPTLRKVIGNPILATLGLNPLNYSERRMLMRRSKYWSQAAKRQKTTGLRKYTRGRSDEARWISRTRKVSDLFGTRREDARQNPRRRARRNDEGPIVITGAEGAAAYRMLALKGALKLELLGMRRSRGPSALSIVKREFGLKGSKQAVLAKFTQMCEDVVEHRAKPPGFNPRRRARHNGRNCANPRHRHGRRARRNGDPFPMLNRARRNEGTTQINVPFRDGQKITPAQMRAWLRGLPEGQVKRNIIRRFEQGLKQYKRFHLGAEPRSFTYRAVQMGSAGKQITDVDVVVSEGKEWAATYQVPRHSKKYEGKGADGRYIHTHGDESGAKLEVDIKRPAAKRLLPERFHTADGKFVGVVPTRNVRITDWYRG